MRDPLGGVRGMRLSQCPNKKCTVYLLDNCIDIHDGTNIKITMEKHVLNISKSRLVNTKKNIK